MLGRQLAGLTLGGGGALSDAEKKQIVAAARTEAAVGAQGTRLFEDQYELKTGQPQDAARGLEDRMCVDQSHQAAFYSRVAKGVDGIEEEAAEFGDPFGCDWEDWARGGALGPP